MVESVDIIKNNFKRYLGLTILLNITFVFFLYFSGFFNIGLLSDSYEDLYNALNHTFADFFSDKIYTGRFRPLLFILLNFISSFNNFFHINYDNFLIFNSFNLFLFITYGIIGGFIVYKIKQNYISAILTNIILIIFPNNIINLCWTASFFEILGMILIFLHLFIIYKIKNNLNTNLSIIAIFIFISGLFLKEIFIIIPFISICFSFIIFGKFYKKIKVLIIVETLIFVIYFLYRLVFISGIKYTDYNMNEMGLLLIKMILSLFIPGDYILTQKKLLSLDLLLYVYLFTILALSIFTILTSKISARKFLGLLLILLISVLPYFYAGYIRPQLIFIPFSIFVVTLSVTLEKPAKNKTGIILLFLLLIQYTYNSYNVIKGWENAYNISIKRITNLFNYDINFNNTIIIGNVSRIEQYYMFDKISYIYNYWKYQDFVLKDSIYNYLSITTLNSNPENAEINCSKINDYYLIKTCNKDSFINVSEFGGTSQNQFTINNVGEVVVKRRNNINKITEIIFKPFDLDKKILIYDGKGIRYPK